MGVLNTLAKLASMHSARALPVTAAWRGGCRKREHDLDWDRVRWRAQAAARAQAGWTSFIGAVGEELVDVFFMALEEADAFCSSEACKSRWCDRFPRGSHEMQSWHRK